MKILSILFLSLGFCVSVSAAGTPVNSAWVLDEVKENPATTEYGLAPFPTNIKIENTGNNSGTLSLALLSKSNPKTYRFVYNQKTSSQTIVKYDKKTPSYSLEETVVISQHDQTITVDIKWVPLNENGSKGAIILGSYKVTILDNDTLTFIRTNGPSGSDQLIFEATYKKDSL